MAENPIKYADLLQPDDSITNAIKQLEKLSETYGGMLDKVKADAGKLEISVKKVSSATEEGKAVTRNAVTEADKLAKAQADLENSMTDTAKAITVLKLKQSESNQMTKLVEKLNRSAEGSYDRLSAQYSINKIKLNGMSESQRAATDEGRKLETETNSIYQEMKRLQEATGKTSLNVGNYKDATFSLIGTLKKQTQELVKMRIAGQEGTAEYKRLLKSTGELKDEISDTKNEINSMASDTSHLDSVLSGAAAASGGFSVFTGAMQLFGSESEDVQEAQAKLQAAIAITTGLQAVQNAVQKDSALMMGISKLQTFALTKAEAYRRLIQIQGTSATVGATVAQKAFNLAASANPYVILALALVTVVGALVLFANGTEVATERQSKLNEVQKIYLEYLQIESEKISTLGAERVKTIENELAVAKARNASSRELGEIEDKLASEKRRTHAQLMGFYSNEINSLDENKKKLNDYRAELSRLQTEKALGNKKVKVDLELNGKVTKADVDDAITAIQGKVDNANRVVEIAVKLKEEDAALKAQDEELKAKRIEDAKAFVKTELELSRKAEDAKIKLIANSGTQQAATIRANYDRQVADLVYQLANEKNLTEKGRKAINSTILSLRKQAGVELKDLEIKLAGEYLNARRTTESLELATMEEGAAKRRAQTKAEFDKQIEDLQIRLQTEKGLNVDQKKEITKQISALSLAQSIELSRIDDETALAELTKQKDLIEMKLQTVVEGSNEEIKLRVDLLKKQRQIELAQNALLAEDVRQKESDINAKYDALILKETSKLGNDRALLIFDQQQALNQSEFDLLDKSEKAKTRFKLQAEKERLQKILELNKTAAVKLTDLEVATIQNNIKLLDKEMNGSKNKDYDLYSLAGINLSDEKKAAINESTQFAIGQVQSFLQSKIESAQVAVDAAKVETDAAKSKLDAEIKARSDGYASNVGMAQKELATAKKNQADAIKEQQKAQKAQAAIETLQQTSSLITASAKIWGTLGFPWAIPALGIMWGSFIAAKLKASQVTKQESVSYGEGGLEILEGGSHASGNDIPIGKTRGGKQRRAEGGEALAIINKNKTRKYKSLLPGIIDSINKGTFEERYSNAYNSDMMQSNVFSSVDLTKIENSVDDIRSQGQKKTYTDARGNTVELYKNLKRTILSNN